MKTFKVRELAAAAAIAAVYAALTMVLAPISYGAIQCRISEALCILPFFFPAAAWGLFLGCAISNIISAAGVLDIVFGSLATLLACLSISALGRGYRRDLASGGALKPSWLSCILACAMPVVFNGPIIGAVLAYMFPLDDSFWSGFWVFFAQVALGEAIVMFVLGVPLMRYICKLNIIRELTLTEDKK